MATVLKWQCYKMDLVIKWPLTQKLILGLADHRAVYNLHSDDGLVYFVKIYIVQQVIIPYNRSTKCNFEKML